MDLVDDCIDEICEWLPLKSLAALGMVCKRLNQVANGYFRRKHPTKNLLMMNYKGEVNLYPDQLYVQCFSENFQNIVIHGSDLIVYNYAACKFKGTKLKRISIYAANLSELHIKCISGIIQHAEIVEFIRCTFAGSLHEILQQCSNMKHLALKSITECTENGRPNQWLLEKYPTLKHLHWAVAGALPPELCDFFKQNPNVDSFYGDGRILPFIRTHKIQLNELVLKLTNSIEKTFEQLSELSAQNAIQSLYLLCGYCSFWNDQLPVLNEIKGIRGTGVSSTIIINLFPLVKLISTDITSLKQATELSKQLLHLEEAYFDVKQIDLIIPFIRFSKKLTKIYISNTSNMKPGNKFNLFALNKQRKKLAGASDVTIYLKEEAYFKIKCMSTGSIGHFVQIKSIEALRTTNAFAYTLLNN